MTRSIADKLIYYYTDNISISEQMQSFFDIQKFLVSKCLDAGICKVLHVVIGLSHYDAYNDFWIVSKINSMPESRLKNDGYLFRAPIYLHSKDEIIKSLRNRLELLKTF